MQSQLDELRRDPEAYKHIQPATPATTYRSVPPAQPSPPPAAPTNPNIAMETEEPAVPNAAPAVPNVAPAVPNAAPATRRSPIPPRGPRIGNNGGWNVVGPRLGGRNARERREMRIGTGAHSTRVELMLRVPPTATRMEANLTLLNELKGITSLLAMEEPELTIRPWKGRDDHRDDLFPSEFPDSIGPLMAYKKRLRPTEKGGDVWGSLHLRLSRPWEEVSEEFGWIAEDNNFRIHKCALQCEETAELGWLLYSLRQMQQGPLSAAISSAVRAPIAVRLRKIANTGDPGTKALHVSCDAADADRVRGRLFHIYSASEWDFPLGTKMRLVPPDIMLFSEAHKAMSRHAIGRQEQFTRSATMF